MELPESLPEPLPTDPLPLAASWFQEALRRKDQPNPNAMVLATSTLTGAPAARVVLCKAFETGPGCLRFVSNYHSRKGRELESNPRAAAVLHWDHLRRQVRFEGVVTRASAAESDAYFATRAWGSRLGAHASHQSEPIASRAALDERLAEQARRFGDQPAPGRDIPRPEHWGGYVLWIDTAELWAERDGRLHDRALFTRSIALQADGSFTGGAWTATRLQP
jgi:pyridoxamine 5'-phosphate oxidase